MAAYALMLFNQVCAFDLLLAILGIDILSWVVYYLFAGLLVVLKGCGLVGVSRQLCSFFVINAALSDLGGFFSVAAFSVVFCENERCFLKLPNHQK